VTPGQPPGERQTLLHEFVACRLPLGRPVRHASLVVGRRDSVKIFTLGFGKDL
jgi:hypothetical protein